MSSNNTDLFQDGLGSEGKHDGLIEELKIVLMIMCTRICEAYTGCLFKKLTHRAVRTSPAGLTDLMVILPTPRM